MHQENWRGFALGNTVAAKGSVNDPHKLYLIEMLTEHAEEEEMTKEFLKWAAELLEE
jgi:hypothetical protein